MLIALQVGIVYVSSSVAIVDDATVYGVNIIMQLLNVLVKGSKMDTFPDEPWLRCGVSGCSKLNVHSKCHGIKLINGQQKSVTDFCKLYVRYGFGINIESGKKSYFC